MDDISIFVKEAHLEGRPAKACESVIGAIYLGDIVIEPEDIPCLKPVVKPHQEPERRTLLTRFRGGVKGINHHIRSLFDSGTGKRYPGNHKTALPVRVSKWNDLKHGAGRNGAVFCTKSQIKGEGSLGLDHETGLW